MRSQSASASSSWFVLTRTVLPLRRSQRTWPQSAWRASTSTPSVGSSRIRKSGSWRSARPSASRRRRPPESAPARSFARSASPVSARISATRASRFGTANRSAAKRRFCRTVSSSWSAVSWVTTPIRRRTSVGNGETTASPRQRTAPLDGRLSPATRLITVVFPAPFGPRMPTTEPGAIASENRSSATRSPNRFVASSSSISAWGCISLSHGLVGRRVAIRALSSSSQWSAAVCRDSVRPRAGSAGRA